jgi:hypothetical protein
MEQKKTNLIEAAVEFLSRGTSTNPLNEKADITHNFTIHHPGGKETLSVGSHGSDDIKGATSSAKRYAGKHFPGYHKIVHDSVTDGDRLDADHKVIKKTGDTVFSKD